MKKSLIALAVLAASGASFAQSTVTLSGKMNIGIAKTGDAKAALTGGADGSDSRIIFRGTEDLGGGLKANFHAETGFKPDTGNLDNAGAVATTYDAVSEKYTSTATASQLFQRQAWGGLSGGFGELRAGRQYSLGFFGSIANMPSTYTDPQLAVGLGFNGMGSRNNDQIQYWSPSMGGAQLRVSTQLAGDTATKTDEIALAYTAGALTVNLTNAKVKGTSGSHMGLNAAYNFGAAAVAAGIVDKAGDGTGKGSFVRVTAPMGAMSLFAGYATNSDTKTNAQDVGAFYSLSKRTRLYALYGTGNKAMTDRTSFGIDHNF